MAQIHISKATILPKSYENLNKERNRLSLDGKIEYVWKENIIYIQNTSYIG